MKETDNQEPQEDTSADLDEFSTLDISDDQLEEADSSARQAKKEAKKNAKKILSPEERKQLLIKRGAIGGAATLVLIALLLAVPATRWPLLNFVGFRSTVVLTVQDQSQKPVALASVKIDETAAVTDQSGQALFQGLPLGKKTALIQKTGYGDKTTTFTSGIGTTKQTYQLKVIGIKLDVDIKNWLSGGPLEGATVTYGEANGMSDATGRATLVIPPTDDEKIEITVSANGYLEKKVETETKVLSREVLLVPAQKNYFMSKRDGKFDIFSSNLDGSNQQKIIEASGKEDESLLQFSIHRGNKQAVLVANREGKMQNSRLIAEVYLVDLERASLRKVDEGSDVQLLDWGNDAIAYTKTIPSLNYDDPGLSKIMLINSTNNRLSEAASANYFQSSLVAQNKLFYIPADAYRPIENASLTSYDLTSAARKSYIQDRSVQYITRASFASLQAQDNTGAVFELQIAQGSVKQIDRRPTASLSVATSPNGENAAWSDRRDGQGTLLVRSIKENTERAAKQAPGLTGPVRFVGDTALVVRVVTSAETADYVVDLASGTMKKIVDVSNIANGPRQFGL